MMKSNRAYSPGTHAAAISAHLLDWYAVHQRDLPWRRSRDPYRIWVSEVMLQQTRVETVIPYYERWFQQFPTLSDLAAASEEQVLKAWEGLGYYSRARNLHQAVREVAARYGGEVPDDPGAVSELKGVGPYTAGAVLSIAFNRAVPAVDGNVMRVLTRVYLIDDDIAQPATRKGLEGLAAALIPPGQAGAFNQALMELGALICTPTAPACAVCPLAAFCRARAEGRQEEFPVKAKAKPPRPVDMVAVVIFDDQGRLLLVRRPAEGLLGGLWEFPGGERPEGLTWEQAAHAVIQGRLGIPIVLEAELGRVKHVFTHLVWDLRAFTATVGREPGLAAAAGLSGSGKAAPGLAAAAGLPPDGEDLRWVRPSELDRFAMSAAHRKIASLAVGGTKA